LGHRVHSRDKWEGGCFVSGRPEPLLRRCSHCALLDHVSVAQLLTCSQNATVATRESWKSCCLSFLGRPSLRSEYVLCLFRLVLPSSTRPIPHPQAFPERAHDTRPAWSLSQPVHRNVETPHRQTHAVCLCRPRCLVLVPSRPDTYTLSSVHPEEQESTCATVPVSIQA
jgi:hypothetical protein